MTDTWFKKVLSPSSVMVLEYFRNKETLEFRWLVQERNTHGTDNSRACYADRFF